MIHRITLLFAFLFVAFSITTTPTVADDRGFEREYKTEKEWKNRKKRKSSHRKIYNYTPVVDPGRTNMAKFKRDLKKCRKVAAKAQKKYRKRRTQQAVANFIVGALVGAVTGAVIGGISSDASAGEGAALGAALGATAGLATNDSNQDQVKLGPRRIVDRCMQNRGHQILNDAG